MKERMKRKTENNTRLEKFIPIKFKKKRQKLMRNLMDVV